jgi:hypothetical protein
MAGLWWKAVLATLAGVGTLQALVRGNRESIDLFFMKFFRDLGRYKAIKRRLAGQGGGDGGKESKGLLAFLASEEDPLQGLLDLDAEKEDELHLITYSLSDLFHYGNHDSEGGSILLGVLGRVYDVTEGDKYYGPMGTYGGFAGHDITYALATGCKALTCVETDWTAIELTEEQLLEAKKWLSFFHLHDKYPLVGKVEGDSFEELIQQLLEREDEATLEEMEGNGSLPIGESR